MWRPDDRCLAHPECNFLDPEWHLHIMANCSVIVLGETDYPRGSSRTILQVLVFIPVTSHVTSTLSAWEEQPLPVSPLQLPFVYYYAKRQPHMRQRQSDHQSLSKGPVLDRACLLSISWTLNLSHPLTPSSNTQMILPCWYHKTAQSLCKLNFLVSVSKTGGWAWLNSVMLAVIGRP